MHEKVPKKGESKITYFKNTSSRVETPTPIESIYSFDLFFSSIENSLEKELLAVAGKL